MPVWVHVVFLSTLAVSNIVLAAASVSISHSLSLILTEHNLSFTSRFRRFRRFRLPRLPSNSCGRVDPVATMTTLMYLPMLDEVRQHLIGCSILAAFATLTIALRLYGRHFSIGYGWDDFLIVFAWIFSLSLVAEMAFRTCIAAA